MWTRIDLNWLASSYPTLKETKPGQIEGNLTFKMLRTGGQYLVNPPHDLVTDTSPPDHLYINDTYNVRLTWQEGQSYPIAHEIGGKLAKTAKRLSKSLLDMHQYEQDGALCLTAAMDLERTFRNGFKLDVFVEELLIPYLFAQSHYDKTQVWLWGELSHGYMGLLEWLARQKDYDDTDIVSTYKHLKDHAGSDKIEELLKVRPRGHRPCLCGSKKKTRICHPEVKEGIVRLRAAISRSN